MGLDSDLSYTLKEMWRIDGKIAEDGDLNEAEKDFYNKHLPTIINYYGKQSEHWKDKKELK